MAIRVDRKSLDAVVIRIRMMEERVGHLDPLFIKIGSYLSMVNMAQFASEGAYSGTPWKPLKPDYKQWKIAHGYSKKILNQTGDMRQSFVSVPMRIESIQGNSATFGSNHPLAVYHQRGTERNGKPAIPARPIMVKTHKMASDIRDITTEYIVNGPRKVWIRSKVYG